MESRLVSCFEGRNSKNRRESALMPQRVNSQLQCDCQGWILLDSGRVLIGWFNVETRVLRRCRMRMLFGLKVMWNLHELFSGVHGCSWHGRSRDD